MRAQPCEILKVRDESPICRPSLRAKEARVLLIDDDRTTRRMVNMGLKDYCRMSEAPDATQGITLYNYLHPDIVFMDIELPDGNGRDLLQWMLCNDPCAYVVMFSGHYDRDIIRNAMKTGARGFVSKPFDLQRMLYFIEQCPKTH